jgi:hypothetical protein
MKRLTLAVLLLGALLFTGCVGAVHLRAFDDLVLAGRNAVLRAKVERGGTSLSRPDVAGAKLLFEVLHAPKTLEQGKPEYVRLCEAFTDSDGIASVEMKGFFEGTHLIRTTYLADPEVRCFSYIFVVGRDLPILVCDIDHTIADVSTLGLLTTAPENIPALPGAVEALKKLSQKYLIVYLTARDDSFYDATKQWLALKGFPQGPVFFSDLSKTAFIGSAGEFKARRLTQWRKAGLNLQVGIGDRNEDAIACLAIGMRAFILRGKPDDVPAGARAAASWSEIVEDLDR